MITVDEIDKAILELEAHDASYATCERLAWLYVVKDHIKPIEEGKATTGDLIGNEFVCACSGLPLQQVMNILAEHMEAIKVLYPREYIAILQKIKELK